MEFDRLTMNRYGRPMPQKAETEVGFLMPRSFNDWITPRLKPAMTVFEFGGGNSTLYLARRVQRVTTIEYHRWWCDALTAIQPANVDLRFYPVSRLHEYAEQIIGAHSDIVIVDGMRRADCLLLARTALRPAGFIVLDDAQAEAREEQKILLGEGWRETQFRDGPEKHTSVFVQPTPSV